MIFYATRLVKIGTVSFIFVGLFFSGLDKGECSEEEIERAKSMVPKSLESYVER